MGLYERFVLPRLVHYTCSRRPQMRQREKVVPMARGEVLEVGFGTGLNLPYYDPEKIERVHALEPAREMWERARIEVERAPFPVNFLECRAEAVPLEPSTVDTAVVTYTLCTIDDLERALTEIRRVLRADGELVFCEHGAAPDADVRRWQDRVTPVWKRLGGGCRLNRDIPSLLRAAGFAIRDLETMYLPGWKPASFNCWGAAVPR